MHDPSDMDIPHIDDALKLADMLKPTWAARSADIPAWHPRNEGDSGAEGGPGGVTPPAGDTQPGGEGELDHEAEAKKWKALARKHESQSKANAEAARKLKELEEADKTEAQRAADKATAAEQRAMTAEGTALRLDVALDKAPDGMSIAQIRKLSKRLTGATREELEADAEELFADFGPGPDAEQSTRRRPRERLRPGAAPADSDEDGETDPSKLAAKVPRMYS